ncbi:MAG: helix-turn-helix domain-containing protein [Phycisphaerales bacterium]|nr:helix-turn-helix domain-containing protein [Phycisphaerales bacterium]
MAAFGSAKSPASSTPDVMTVEQLADYLQISRSTLYKLAQEGKVPGQKVGKHWRFRKDAIDRWLDDKSSAQTRRGG